MLAATSARYLLSLLDQPPAIAQPTQPLVDPQILDGQPAPIGISHQAAHNRIVLIAYEDIERPGWLRANGQVMRRNLVVEGFQLSAEERSILPIRLINDCQMVGWLWG